MLITQKQMDVLDAASYRDFVARVDAHIERCLPEHHSRLDSDQIAELVDIGMERGAGYEFISERDVCKFVDLMLTLGVEFDEDPDLPWAREILESPDIYDPSERIDILFDRAIEELKLVAQQEAKE